MKKSPLCRRHFKKLLKAGGIKNNHDTDMGLRQLQHIKNHFTTITKFRVWIMKHPENFIKEVLPADYIIAHRQLGPYRFFHQNHEISKCLTTPKVEHLLKITGLRVYIDEIRDRGSVIIPNMFT